MLGKFGIDYTAIFFIVAAVDFAASVSSWLAAEHGSSDYFVDHIKKFNFHTSVLDLVLMCTLRTAMCSFAIYRIAALCRESVKENYGPLHRYRTIVTQLRLVAGLVLFINLVYVAVKVGLILWSLKHDPPKDRIGSLYFAVLWISFAFVLLESVLLALNSKAIKRFRHRAVFGINSGPNRVVVEEEEESKKKVEWRRLAALAVPELGLLLPGAFCLLISTASVALGPRYFGVVVDAAQKKGMDGVNESITILVIIFFVGAVAAMFRSYLFTLAGQRLVARVRKHLYAAIVKQGVAFFDKTRTGELTNRLSSDTLVLQNALTVNISMLLRNFLQIVASVVFMMTLSWKLTLVLLSIIPLIAVGAVQYGRVLKTLRKDFQDELAAASTVAEEAISSIRTVRSFSKEERAMLDYNINIDKSFAIGKKLSKAIGIFTGVVGIIAQGAIALVLWYGGKLVVHNVKHHSGGITAGVLVSFMLYTITVAAAFAVITSLYGEFMQAVGSSIRIFDLIDRKPELPTSGGETAREMSGSVVFDEVYFRYPSRPDTEVLKGVSFKVEPGSVVALVGPSGGGKSTIVSLLERFYDPTSGCILLGNKPLVDLDPVWVHQQMALVGQEPVLFAYTIAENIAYGRNATQDEIECAARQANAHDFIMSFEDGYDTVVGERGVRLSGGQKQRVAIARALLMDPALLLLDEATSALDAESEHCVQEAIDRAMEGRSVLVIAHRLSTVRNATKVLVIDKGRIVEEGTHNSLLELNGVYKRLVLRQLASGNGQ